MNRYLFLLFLIVLPMLTHAQADTNKWTPPAPQHYAFIHSDENVIKQQGELDSVFKKLVALHTTHHGKVSIVHIGDSHIQGDGITSVLRNGFRQYFGDAGRGLVFPYQLAGSNAPHDIVASSNTSWRNNRLSIAGSSIRTGICGYGIESNKENATVNLELKNIDGRRESFDRMVFFLGKDKAFYNISDSSLTTLPSIETHDGIDAPSLVFETDSMLTGFKLARTVFTPENNYCFYGVSLEHKDDDGVIYHTIGVNGARYDQYTDNELFWEQLKALHGDLFIVSMGTNEAQNRQINEQGLMAVCDAFVKKLHTIAPGAEVLITTPAGSYYKMKRPNASVQAVSHALVHFCEEKGYAYWDLDHICGGKTSAAGWKKNGLMSHDFVHYNAQGYQLQGDLLLNAFARAYNSYAKAHPYKAPKTAEAEKLPVIKAIAKKPVAPKKDKEGPVGELNGIDPEVIPAAVAPSKLDSIPAPHTKKLKVEYSK